MRFNIKRFIGVVVSIGFMVFLDLFTKMLAVDNLKFGEPVNLIDGLLGLTYLENKGMAWGMLSGQRVIFIIITVIVLGLLCYAFARIPKEKRYLPLLVDLCILTAGAVGNLVDRIVLGYVRDFIEFKFINFPIFNVADIFATVSTVLLFILVLFVYTKDDDFTFLRLKSKKESNNGDN